MQRYSMLIQWDSSVNTYTVSFPEFPDHITQGSSWQDAARNGEILLGQILERSDQPATKQIEKSDTCSFCDRLPDQIQHLTRGPGDVTICNACVDICREVIEEGGDFNDMRQAIAKRDSHKGSNLPLGCRPKNLQ